MEVKDPWSNLSAQDLREKQDAIDLKLYRNLYPHIDFEWKQSIPLYMTLTDDQLDQYTNNHQLNVVAAMVKHPSLALTNVFTVCMGAEPDQKRDISMVDVERNARKWMDSVTQILDDYWLPHQPWIVPVLASNRSMTKRASHRLGSRLVALKQRLVPAKIVHDTHVVPTEAFTKLYDVIRQIDSSVTEDQAMRWGGQTLVAINRDGNMVPVTDYNPLLAKRIQQSSIQCPEHLEFCVTVTLPLLVLYGMDLKRDPDAVLRRIFD